VRLPPILNIDDRQQRVRAFLRQIEKHQRRAPERAEQIDKCNGEDQCRKNAARSACIEADEGKSIRRKVGQDIARDQIAGDDEEGIDADKSALKAADPQMKQHHADDGHGTRSPAISLQK
jgi:hypothetical protein